jgi:hypothetical protein
MHGQHRVAVVHHRVLLCRAGVMRVMGPELFGQSIWVSAPSRGESCGMSENGQTTWQSLAIPSRGLVVAALDQH